jgi:hypothetical protein
MTIQYATDRGLLGRAASAPHHSYARCGKPLALRIDSNQNAVQGCQAVDDHFCDTGRYWHFSDVPGRSVDVRFGIERMWLAGDQNDANDPTRTYWT